MSEAPAGVSASAEQLALTAPPAGAGVVAAGVVELAAGLCESIARGCLDGWTDGRGAAIQAATLRARSRQAGSENVDAYVAARQELARQPRPGATGRDAALLATLVGAADTLIAIAAAAADCAALAAEITRGCEPSLRADAAGAAELAAAAARSTAALVDINLALVPGDARRERVSTFAAAAEASVARARAAEDGD